VNALGNIHIHSTSRLHGQHLDFLQARIDSLGAGVSRISIQADHLVSGNPPPVEKVSEASTLLLLGSGLAGLSAAAWTCRRRK
jgi:PEP-CTERM motif